MTYDTLQRSDLDAYFKFFDASKLNIGECVLLDGAVSTLVSDMLDACDESL